MMKFTRNGTVLFLTLIFILSSLPVTTAENHNLVNKEPTMRVNSSLGLELYEPTFDAYNIKEPMTLSPMFTPDNAHEIYVDWINRANQSIIVQNQYLTQFDSGDWSTDSHPIVRALVEANSSRGVNVQVQFNEVSDSDNITSYFQNIGIEVRWMGNSDVNPDNQYLDTTHNKLVIIDNKVTIVSSINFSENAFTNNREAGLVIQNTNIASYYKSIFEDDWESGEIPPGSTTQLIQTHSDSITKQDLDYISHTDIPKANFTGTYNVTAFTNPDNANDLIFKYLMAAEESIYVSMYTISKPDFNETLIDLKRANPNLDIQVLISNRRVTSDENEATHAAAQSLVDNLIPVYNSTKEDTAVDGLYHNKYWIIDNKHTFVYSGNWSPRSVTSPTEQNEGGKYTSGEANRDMGIAVHDAPDIATFFKTQVWDQDVTIADAWELPVGIKQLSFTQSDIISGTVQLSAILNGLSSPSISYKFGSADYQPVSYSGNGFSLDFDTAAIDNGVTSFSVKAETTTQTFEDSVTVTITNIPDPNDWRLLITEVFADPDAISDADGEFIEITNSFPFDIYLENWQIGDDETLYTFDTGDKIDPYSSLILARDKSAFDAHYGIVADFEASIELVNTKDYVQLINHRGDYIDVVAYEMPAPDGSEQLSAATSGQSIQRSPLHIDTDSSSDFITNSPTPKHDVPHISLNGEDPNESDSEPVNTMVLSSMIIALSIPIFSRRKYETN